MNSKQEAAPQQLIAELQHAEQALFNTEEERASELFGRADAALASANARLEAVEAMARECMAVRGISEWAMHRRRFGKELAAALQLEGEEK